MRHGLAILLFVFSLTIDSLSVELNHPSLVSVLSAFCFLVHTVQSADLFNEKRAQFAFKPNLKRLTGFVHIIKTTANRGHVHRGQQREDMRAKWKSVITCENDKNGIFINNTIAQYQPIAIISLAKYVHRFIQLVNQWIITFAST